MKKINELHLISGSINSKSMVTNAVNASMAHVLRSVRDIHPQNNQHGEAAQLCHNYQPPVTPKNGDRNALGQQYSWGTWWDDTH